MLDSTFSMWPIVLDQCPDCLRCFGPVSILPPLFQTSSQTASIVSGSPHHRAWGFLCQVFSAILIRWESHFPGHHCTFRACNWGTFPSLYEPYVIQCLVSLKKTISISWTKQPPTVPSATIIHMVLAWNMHGTGGDSTMTQCYRVWRFIHFFIHFMPFSAQLQPLVQLHLFCPTCSNPPTWHLDNDHMTLTTNNHSIYVL